MTPEEIAECRAARDRFLAGNSSQVILAEILSTMLEHIDSQADEIKQANHRYTELQNVCDDQEKEIKRLREVAIPDAVDAERDRWLHDYSQKVDEITRLQKVISEPVESFGTPELLEWANGLQKIIADYPESERGELPFVMLMGSHLEKFAKSWNSPAMKRLEAERAVWIKHYQDNRKKHAALKKLGEMVRARGKALVEERARRLVAAGAECFFRTPIKGSILSKCDKGIYCDWTTCPIKDEKRQDSREQLRAEGVIG